MHVTMLNQIQELCLMQCIPLEMLNRANIREQW